VAELIEEKAALVSWPLLSMAFDCDSAQAFVKVECHSHV
jgi:hypothetical protein